MIRALPLLVAVAAAAGSAGHGCRAPRARIVVQRLDGTRPELAIVRCQTSGLRAPITYVWALGVSLKQQGWNAPKDESALLVQVPDKLAGVTLACTATDATGAVAQAVSAIGEPTIAAVTMAKAPGEPMVVTGSGFGQQRGDDDALWLVPPRGPALPADHACKAASWNDTRVTACAPVVHGSFQLRVQSGGRLVANPSPVSLP